jgi:NodT family efflux transporter outer membrane factor (OMF) lipoprotein
MKIRSKLKRFSRATIVITAGGLSGLTGGCLSVGPDYEEPVVALPDAWQQKATADLQDGPSNLERWWARFNDPILNELIAKARRNNLDLRTAALRLEEAMALRGVASSAYYGSVDLDAAAMTGQVSENATQLQPGADPKSDYYTIGANAAWEADVWGRIRRSVESADAVLDATLEDYRDVLVLLQSRVAGLYVDVRTTQKQIILTERNVDLQKATLKLTRDRFDAGLSADLDVRRAELNLARTESTLPTLYANLGRVLNALSVLLGEMPGSLENEIGVSDVIPKTAVPVYTGLPANLLRQRPDIRAAERQVAAQNARIGVAASDYYPRFLLVGDLRVESVDYDNLLGGESVAYGFGPKIRWNLFSGGRIKNQVRAEEARTAQAEARYEQTVLQAVEETETAMVSYVQELNRFAALGRAVVAAEASVDQTQTLYRSGLTDFQNVLNMERDLFEQQNQEAASEGEIARRIVDIFRALGGGWQDAPRPIAVN